MRLKIRENLRMASLNLKHTGCIKTGNTTKKCFTMFDMITKNPQGVTADYHSFKTVKIENL